MTTFRLRYGTNAVHIWVPPADRLAGAEELPALTGKEWIPYYLRVSVSRFQQTRTSSVERIVLLLEAKNSPRAPNVRQKISPAIKTIQ